MDLKQNAHVLRTAAPRRAAMERAATQRSDAHVQLTAAIIAETVGAIRCAVKQNVIVRQIAASARCRNSHD